ncbi:hypothetical protein MIB92_18765 [Aestuariirhabdus sp. Z084]|uniref:hypothetical protein n=1 Tax=Aestuariirhabdus haliotis TaxID=2918751 RepID=UPI00201B3ED3|nr:hypothetical protein [Aestuariirhabdus haliotis]MCL6417709.1 hypothetical protein [Aestuariirhabdus haliotis]MCL6421660.1 hypothetical protein [Aestuariirhabdus haliotis]
MSQGNFIYRSGANAAVIALAVYGSGGTAAVVGIAAYSAEKFYELAGKGINSLNRNMTVEKIYEGVSGDFYEGPF